MNKLNTGVIHSNEAYSKAMVLQRLGISQRFWDKMLDDGLPYVTVGHTRWITGQSLLEFFESHSQTKVSEAE
ncbi:hypothetical protein Pan241w_53230 [Gimesia alba]|uniref:Helix-turn-helix domain protein n=1 Tax=Gimesia alba TaxID=2527973 RepID=A0A517RMW5_9PLAN|nr:topoisomerase II [Gimesia alba]QDT45204.1 hypothetical protein Pan241w_53230 [Gimesia alba]